MNRLYYFAYTVCLLLWSNQTSSLKQLKPKPIRKLSLQDDLNRGLTKEPKTAPDNLLTKSGAIASLILSSLPLNANAAAGIPVGKLTNTSLGVSYAFCLSVLRGINRFCSQFDS